MVSNKSQLLYINCTPTHSCLSLVSIVEQQERRGELESLDLAINMQREQLHTLKHSWRLTKRDRSASGKHLNEESDQEEGRREEIEHYMNVRLTVCC